MAEKKIVPQFGESQKVEKEVMSSGVTRYDSEKNCFVYDEERSNKLNELELHGELNFLWSVAQIKHKDIMLVTQMAIDHMRTEFIDSMSILGIVPTEEAVEKELASKDFLERLDELVDIAMEMDEENFKGFKGYLKAQGILKGDYEPGRKNLRLLQ